MRKINIPQQIRRRPRIPMRQVRVVVPLPRTKAQWRALLRRPTFSLVGALVIFSILLVEVLPIFEPTLQARNYDLGDNTKVLSAASTQMADKVRFDSQQQAYTFNAGYKPSLGGQETIGGPKISAVLPSDGSKGVTVTDPFNDVDVTVKPLFEVLSARQDKNRIIYPLRAGNGWLVYTLKAGQVKEDIVLRSSADDHAEYAYDLDLGNSLEAKIQRDGSVYIYGNTMLSGSISTGSDKDAQLLEKARKNAAKDKLLFIIPAPIVNEFNVTKSTVKARYEIKQDKLTLVVDNLKKAQYPIAIDPSVYVTSAAQFMAGNNESNIDFDTDYDLIQKGKLTGARIPSWSAGTVLPAARWNAGYATGGGYTYVIGGSSGSADQTTVYWSKFNTASGSNTLVSPGTCATVWCTDTAYNLPATRVGLSAAVYNGSLYAIGGNNATDCTAGNGKGGVNGACNTVYVAKLSANGEPISWTQTSSLTTGRKFAAAVAYRNKLYVLGGQTNATLNGVQTVEAADIKPDGTLGTWSTTGMTSFPAARWAGSALQYNGYIYMVGGADTATEATTVYYAKINSDGTIGTWITTNSFTTARAALGGNLATIYNGYMYITGGCTNIATAGSCSTMSGPTNDFQLASINADGSISNFATYDTSLTSASTTGMTGYGLSAWRGALYGIGGCTVSTSATTCSGVTQTQAKYAVINTDGDVSRIFGSPASDFYDGTAYLPDLPAAGTTTGIGRMANGVVVNGGYIYVIGGCAGTGAGLCTSMNVNNARATIASNGTIGSWTTDTGHDLPVAIAAFGVTVHNNTIYTLGGFTSTGSSRTLYYSAINLADGSLGNWQTVSNVLTTGYGYAYMFARAKPNSATTSYLYYMGGCAGSGGGIGCTTTGYRSDVVRCEITNGAGLIGTVGTSCTTTGDGTQLQLSTGTGIFGGTVYGNFIYLAGGANGLSGTSVSPTGSTCDTDLANGIYSCGGQTNIVQYAKIDNSGNIVRVDNGLATGGWQVATSKLTRQRRRTTAFAVNGYIYIVAGHDGTAGNIATLNDIQRGKINVSTGDVTGFTALSTTITERWDLRAATANGYIYIIGGCTNGDPPASCTNTGGTGMSGVGEYVQVYNNWSASPASYTSSANTPTDRYGGAATVLNGYLYFAGGCTSTASDCNANTTGTAVNTVSYALLGADGSIGTWTNATTGATGALTTDGTTAAPRTSGRLENVGGTLYYIGGQASNAVAVSTVLYSTPNPSTGAPAPWATASNALPAARSQMGGAVYNNRIYITGGFSGTNATTTATVYYSPDLSSGGNIGSAWSTGSNNFTLARARNTTVAYGNNLYVMGGYDGTNFLIDVQYAPIDATGNIGTWKFGPSLPQLVGDGSAFATNGFIYVFGGRSGTTATSCTNNTYTIPVNAEGSLGSAWSQTSVTYTTARRSLAAAYSNGRAYLVGGACGTTAAMTLTGANSAVYGTMQVQPQIADYSLKIDADTDVFPSKYLVNGLDNGIGANWYLTYYSSNSATNTWGQAANAGKVTLGTPGTYTPLDGSGANLNSTTGSRYHMLFLKIDSQLAFGYPEDVSRGPNIRDITLQFTSAPSKRLRNGKTFTGGIQQPLETPF